MMGFDSMEANTGLISAGSSVMSSTVTHGRLGLSPPSTGGWGWKMSVELRLRCLLPKTPAVLLSAGEMGE